MKRFLLVALFALAPAAAFSFNDENVIDVRLTCSSSFPYRRIELFMSAFGEPQFGFRYKGFGLISAGESLPTSQFRLDYEGIGNPLQAVIGGLKDGWSLEMTSTSSKAWERFRVIERPRVCAPPCEVKPTEYVVACKAEWL